MEYLAAVDHFLAQQRALLIHTYNAAWHRGVASYTPELGRVAPSPAHAALPASAGIGGVTGAVLLARRGRRYVAPVSPDTDERDITLALAMRSLLRFRTELSALHPHQGDYEPMTTVPDVVGGANLDWQLRPGETNPLTPSAPQEGDHEAPGLATAAAAGLGVAIREYLTVNAYRLFGGVSVAWAGEQRGFADAVDRNGKTLEWVTEEDENVCADCVALGECPPMALDDWPTVPGGGGTECSVGCRCTFEASDEEAPSQDVIDTLPILRSVADARSDEHDAAIVSTLDRALRGAGV